MMSQDNSAKRIYTIGHSNDTPEELLALLRKHNIPTVVCGRSSPYSKHASQCNRSELRFILNGAQIGYGLSGHGNL